MKKSIALSLLALLAGCKDSTPPPQNKSVSVTEDLRRSPIRHVLLISIDGMHALDLANYAKSHPQSALAALSRHGVTFTDAHTPRPSDSFPGLLALVTGGNPGSTGVYYDDSYDRRLSAPGSNCSTRGTEVVYDESIDFDSSRLDAGGGINPANLPLDPDRGCTPLYPHQFLRTNTIFEVIKAAGGRTAWSDKHPAYDIVNGPSGIGVDDLYTPEVNADNTSDTVAHTEAYDDLKVTAVLNEIDGHDHTGERRVGVPAVFGMNFQAVSVGEKIGGGYLDAIGTPSAGLAGALDHTDQSIGRMLRGLERRDLVRSTLVIVTAKHGQSPIDPARKQIVNKSIIPNAVNTVQEGLAAQVTEDDVALIWLTDSSKTPQVAAQLLATPASIAEVLWGPKLSLVFADPLVDSRAPDLFVQPIPGVIYTGLSATKIAEHGGGADDDTHVALVVANPALWPATIRATVSTAQVAPTIVRALGLDPGALDAVQLEGTPVLPGLSAD